MQLTDLLRESIDIDKQDFWKNERTPTPVRCFAVRLHLMGLSVREVESVLAWSSVDCCYQAVWNRKEKLADHQSDTPTAEPSRVAVDETRIEVDGEKSGFTPQSTRTQNPLRDGCVRPPRDCPRGVHENLVFVQPIRNLRFLRTAFLHRLTERHNVSETEFLVDAGGYLTAFTRHELSGQLDYTGRNHIEKWFQTVTMRAERSHSFWRGSQSTPKR